LLVNAAFAHHFFGTDDPIGHRIRMAEAVDGWRTIVGVVGDVRSARLEEGPEATMYAPLSQEPRADTLLVRTSHEPAAEAKAVRDAVTALDPQQAVSQVLPFDEVVAEATAPSRFRASVVSLFAVLALVLAAVGVYGVVSYTIAQRTMEWGIRLALGVDPQHLVLTIMGQQLGSILLGIGVGLLGCVALAHLIGGFVFGVSSLDPISLGAAVATVLIVAMLASYIPARRVTNIDPLVALRCE
jgi:putative ABC transport system permease protein